MSHQKNKIHRSFAYNPYELAFCGYSQSGKTTMITRLLKDLSSKYRIGYVKHDGHAMDIDREGKDTFAAKASGAQMVFISDLNQFAQIHEGNVDDVTHQNVFLDNDFIFVEGYKDSTIPKILFINKDERIFEDIKSHRFQNVIAYTGIEKTRQDFPSDVPYFHIDDIENIKNHILTFFQLQAQKIPLSGLVLAGGRSKRMNKDKSILDYHGTNQTEYCVDLLTQVCAKVYVSNREEQSQGSVHKNFTQIHDAFLNIGPLGGILSAMTAYSHTAWLVLACDLPFVNKETLKGLVDKRNPFKMASAYKSTNDKGLPEPLCAVYEPKSIFRLLQFLGLGINCPRKILLNSDIQLIVQNQKFALDNINNPQEYQKAVDLIQDNRGVD